MNDPSELTPTKERQPITLSRLNILVHPLYFSSSYSPLNSEKFSSARKSLISGIMTRQLPQSETEVTVFMPQLTNTDTFKSAREYIKETRAHPEFPQWPDFFSNMRKASALPRNIILGPNIIDDRTQRDVDIDILVKRLTKKGYGIDPNTRIVVGGEIFNACVKAAVFKLLELPQVDQVEVDTKSVLSLYSQTVSGSPLDRFEISDWANSLSGAVSDKYRYSTSLQDDHIIISKERW